MKDKKGGLFSISSIASLIILLILAYACWDYYLETKGQNEDKVDFCEDLGYEVDNEVNFFWAMTCYTIDEGIREDYFVIEYKDEEDKFYLKKV